MSQKSAKKHMIYFEVEGAGYAVDSAELAGVATACPFVSYPGLPAGVVGLIQWSGKVFPVVDAFGLGQIDLKHCTFLFSLDDLKGPYREIAIAVPGTVRVFFAESVVPPSASALPVVSAMLIDQDGNEACQLKLSRVAELAARQSSAPEGSDQQDGGSVAA